MRIRRGFKTSLSAAAVSLVVAGAAYAASWDEISKSGSQTKNWLTYGGDLGQQRYWPGKAINAGNVSRLRIKWIFQTGVVGSFENTPIVENGVMYITTPFDHVFAADAKTGKELWHFQHKLGKNIFCCGPNNRGVAVYGDTVILGTLDAHLVALNKKTGEKVWDAEVADSEVGYSLTAAPAIYKDKIIMGIAGGEYGIRGFVAQRGRRQDGLAHLHDPLAGRGRSGWHQGLGRRLCREGRRHQSAEPQRCRREGGSRTGQGLMDARRRRQLDDRYDRHQARDDLRDDRQSVARSRRLASARRQSLVGLVARARCRHRQGQMGLPIHPA